MIDMLLRTDTEAEMAATLPWAREAGGEAGETWITATHGYSLALLGPMMVERGREEEDGSRVLPVVDGRYHANLRLRDESLAALVPAEIRVTPATPRAGWG